MPFCIGPSSPNETVPHDRLLVRPDLVVCCQLSQSPSPDCSTPLGRHCSIRAGYYIWWRIDSFNLLDARFPDSCVAASEFTSFRPRSRVIVRPAIPPILQHRGCISSCWTDFFNLLQPVSLTDIWFLSDTVHSALDCGVTSPSHLRIFTLPFASIVSFPFDPPALRITTAEGFLARITACNVSVYPTNGSASLFASKSGRCNATTISGRFGCCAAVDLFRAGRA